MAADEEVYRRMTAVEVVRSMEVHSCVDMDVIEHYDSSMEVVHHYDAGMEVVRG
jgi:hypothetical protein